MSVEFAVSRPQPRVRWTFRDLVLTGLLTIGLSAVVVLAIVLPRLLGVGFIRDLLANRPLVMSMTVGGLIYLLAVVATYVVIVRRKGATWSDIGFRMPPLLGVLLAPMVFVGQLLLLALVNGLLRTIIGDVENPQVAALTDPNGFSWLNFAVVFTVGAIVAPIVEEMLFRGLLYQWLRSHTSVLVAILVSGAIFSVVHVYPVILPPLFVVGVLLAAVFEWTQSLWVTIMLHFFQNALAISTLFALQAYPNLLQQP